jgi:hypothetical protein
VFDPGEDIAAHLDARELVDLLRQKGLNSKPWQPVRVDQIPRRRDATGLFSTPGLTGGSFATTSTPIVTRLAQSVLKSRLHGEFLSLQFGFR